MEYDGDVSSVIQDAEYSDDVVPIYRGNPFVEALPNIPTPQALSKLLFREPPFEAAWRELPDLQRIGLLPELKKVFKPITRDITLFRRVYSEMLSCYGGRCASDPHYFQKVTRQSAETPPEILINGPNGYAPVTVPVIGISGSGKTTSISRWLDAIPHAIRHVSYKGRPFCTTQIPWVSIDCPSDGSEKTLCGDILLEYDRVMGTAYYARYGRKDVSAAARLQHIARLCSLHGTALLVVDNLENLARVNWGIGGQMLNFLFNLSVLLRIPVVLVGTYEALPLITQSLRQLRRESELGWQLWNRLEGKAWDAYLGLLWKYQLTRDPTPLTAELSAAMYHETQGIPGLTTPLFRLAQERAITTRDRVGHERLSVDLIRSVARDSFEFLQRPLDALRTGRKAEYARYPDLAPNNTDPSPVRAEPSPPNPTDMHTGSTEPPEPDGSPTSIREQMDFSLEDEAGMESTLVARKQQSSYEALKQRGFIVDDLGLSENL